MRYPFILAGLSLCAIGFAINISDVRIGVKYFGTFFCVSGAYAAFPGIVCWYVSRKQVLWKMNTHSFLNKAGEQSCGTV